MGKNEWRGFRWRDRTSGRREKRVYKAALRVIEGRQATYPYGPEFQALVDAKVAELTSERRKGDSKAQQFADRLVASNPNKTSGELLEMVAPERRAELQKLLRYVPPPPESERLRRKRERIRTPLVADLERHLAERAAKPRSRPTGPVNTGCGADNPHDPKEGGS